MNQEEYILVMILDLKVHCEDAYIHVNWRITFTGAGDDATARQADERGKGITFKRCLSTIY